MFEVLQPLAPELFWIISLAFTIAFLLAFSVGANDVSNSFGTSVGARVLTVTQACILATFFEVAGATLLGYSVCDTFRREMYDVNLYDGAQKELMLGALACLIGSSIWNIVATALKMPISGTHSIVGATIGFSVVSRGWQSIKWEKIIRVVASWFASPLLSGLITSLIYILISKTIISKVDPLKNGLKALPLFYGATIFINVSSIVIDGPEVMGLNELPWYAGLFIALVCATITITCVALIMVPRLKREILGELISGNSHEPGPSGNAAIGLNTIVPVQTQQQPAESSEKAAYDNMTFKPDEDRPARQECRPKRRQPPPKPKRELELDPKQLEAAQDVDQPQEQGAATSPTRPPIAPKPAHLLRQMAQDQSQQAPLDDIDLRQDVESGPAVARVQSPSPQQPAQRMQQPPPTPSGERYEVAKLFSSLQILTACFASFAHGTNDVSNAVAPLIPIWNIYADGTENVSQQTQVWILAFGSIGICTGLWAWGRSVMSTISDGLTKITPSKGFSIELGAAISVLLATKLGLPISTTHCKVGSLVIVSFVSTKFLSQDMLLGRAHQQQQQHSQSFGHGKQDLQILDEPAADAVDWRLFSNIAITWVSTVPLAAIASAIVTYILRWLVL